MDLIVNLYSEEIKKCQTELLSDIKIIRALAPQISEIEDFVRKNFSPWVDEAKTALYRTPTDCFVAIENKKIIGFSCFNAIARDFFGPLGVVSERRKCGVGRSLLISSLLELKYQGYAYAIIGSVQPKNLEFYEKSIHAEIISSSKIKSIYQNIF